MNKYNRKSILSAAIGAGFSPLVPEAINQTKNLSREIPTIESIEFGLYTPTLQQTIYDNFKLTSSTSEQIICKNSYVASWKASGKTGNASMEAIVDNNTCTINITGSIASDSKSTSNTSFTLRNTHPRFNPFIRIPYLDEDPKLRVTIDIDLELSFTPIIPKSSSASPKRAPTWGNATLFLIRSDFNSSDDKKDSHSLRKSFRCHLSADVTSIDQSQKYNPDTTYSILRKIKLINEKGLPITNNSHEQLHCYYLNVCELIEKFLIRNKKIQSDPPQKIYLFDHWISLYAHGEKDSSLTISASGKLFIKIAPYSSFNTRVQDED